MLSKVKIYSVSGLAKELGWTRRRARAAIDAGLVDAIRLGKRSVIPAASVAAFAARLNDPDARPGACGSRR